MTATTPFLKHADERLGPLASRYVEVLREGPAVEADTLSPASR